MTAPILPRCVSANTELPTYFFRTDANDVTFLRLNPDLPDIPGVRWAEDWEIEQPHIVLTQTVVAELLFLAAGDPRGMSDADAVKAIDHVLCTQHCDLRACVDAIADEFGETCAGAAAARMSRCVTLAARLVGTEA